MLYQTAVDLENRSGSLVVSQALGAFNLNYLRAAVLTLVTYGYFDVFGFSPSHLVSLVTLVIVAPIALLSLPAGWLADKVAKRDVLVACKALEAVAFLLAAVALHRLDGTLLLVALTVAGVAAAVFGPAKLGILPELVAPSRLLAANAWVGTSATVGVLLGLVSGSALVLVPRGPDLIGLVGVCVAGAGVWSICKLPLMPHGGAAQTGPWFRTDADPDEVWSLLGRLPATTGPMFGRSWFWCQGAINTALIPMYVAAIPESGPTMLATVFTAVAAGFGAGAFAARRVAAAPYPIGLGIVFVAVLMPSVDLALFADPGQTARMLTDFAILSAGTGSFLVLVTTALQTEPPGRARARVIGVADTLSGLAMMAAVGLVLIIQGLGLPVPLGFLATGALTAPIAVLTLRPAMAQLKSTG